MMKRNESDAGHRIAVTQNGHADALAPADVPLRAGDATHTATPLETGETEIWANRVVGQFAEVGRLATCGRLAIGQMPACTHYLT